MERKTAVGGEIIVWEYVGGCDFPTSDAKNANQSNCKESYYQEHFALAYFPPSSEK